MLQFLIEHKAMEAAAVVAVLDLVFALKPSIAANGILHWVYLQLKALSGQPQPPQA